MLHDILNVTRPLFVIDTETTGVNSKEDRIVQIGFQQWGPTGMVKEWFRLINPGVPIPAGATAKHGITDAMAKSAYSFAQMAPSLASGLVDCDYAGQNIRFDLEIIAAEMARAQVPWDYIGARIVDSLRLEALAVPRDLGALHEKYCGAKHEGAHDAIADVKAATAVIAAQLEQHERLPKNLDQLHALQWPGYIDACGLFRFVDGQPFVFFGKWKGKPMRQADDDYWRWVAGPKGGFSIEVREIARNAAAGLFPVPR